jgi:predicted PurR-regulated permease PerM
MNVYQKSQPLPPPWDRLFPLGTRLLVWGVILGVIYILRSFFLLVFLTFVFGYIQLSGVRRLEKFIKNRIVRVILIAVFFLSAQIAVGIFVIPKVQTQAKGFASRFNSYIDRVDQEILDLAAKYPLLREVIPGLKKTTPENGTDAEPSEDTDLKQFSPASYLFQQLVGLGEETEGHKNFDRILETFGSIGGKLASVVSNFLLALLFSFLIVLDLPRLSTSLAGLENTKLRFIYVEVADDIRNFSKVLGQAFEAQFLIAVANALLTAVGISLLGLGKNVAFLSVIVFFCSFVPVAGVFISSVPICLIALQSYDLNRMLLAIVLIIIIHLIEGYILNPRIYGSRMRINPVLVLVILTIGGKLFSFWGLILGVPICTYIFTHAIRMKPGEN